MNFEAGSASGVAKDAFKSPLALGSGTFTKAETGHADRFEHKTHEGGCRYLPDRIKAGGTLLVVAAPEDGEVSATYFGAGAEPEANRPRLSIDGESAR